MGAHCWVTYQPRCFLVDCVGFLSLHPKRGRTMWRMQDDNRVLTETEWKLFRTGLDLLRDSIEEDIRGETDGAEIGIPVFDRLTPEQKLALLAHTAQALRDPAVPMPFHTAANEGAIAAVFSMIRVELETELDIANMKDEE